MLPDSPARSARYPYPFPKQVAPSQRHAAYYGLSDRRVIRMSSRVSENQTGEAKAPSVRKRHPRPELTNRTDTKTDTCK